MLRHGHIAYALTEEDMEMFAYFADIENPEDMLDEELNEVIHEVIGNAMDRLRYDFQQIRRE